MPGSGRRGTPGRRPRAGRAPALAVVAALGLLLAVPAGTALLDADTEETVETTLSTDETTETVDGTQTDTDLDASDPSLDSANETLSSGTEARLEADLGSATTSLETSGESLDASLDAGGTLSADASVDPGDVTDPDGLVDLDVSTGDEGPEAGSPLHPAPQAQANPIADGQGVDVTGGTPAALAAALAVLAWLGKYGSTGGLWTLYSRLTGQDLLDNGNRRSLVETVREQPGASISELADEVGLGWGATVYHLERLEAEGFLASEREGKRRCFFPPGTEDAEALGLLRDERARELAEHILEHPGATQSDVADGIDTSSATVHRRVERLTEAELVEARREGRCVQYEPTERLEALLSGRGLLPA